MATTVLKDAFKRHYLNSVVFSKIFSKCFIQNYFLAGRYMLKFKYRDTEAINIDFGVIFLLLTLNKYLPIRSATGSVEIVFRSLQWRSEWPNILGS